MARACLFVALCVNAGVLDRERPAGVHGSRVRPDAGLPRGYPPAALRAREGAPDPVLREHDRHHLRHERRHVVQRRGKKR